MALADGGQPAGLHLPGLRQADLCPLPARLRHSAAGVPRHVRGAARLCRWHGRGTRPFRLRALPGGRPGREFLSQADLRARWIGQSERRRSEEHTSELQSLMRISYAVFCLKKKKKTNQTNKN